jgi:Protein of unknown function (DUF3253)
MLGGDVIASEHPNRCRICALPLPAKDDGSGICSRRCAGRKTESAKVAADSASLKARILAEVATLKHGTTVCPGELSHRVLPDTVLPLTLLRPLIYELAAARKFSLRQKGTVIIWQKIRGPFRVSSK